MVSPCVDPAAYTRSNSNAARSRSRSTPPVKPRGTVAKEITAKLEAKKKADAHTETQAEDTQSNDPVADGGEEDTLPLHF